MNNTRGATCTRCGMPVSVSGPRLTCPFCGEMLAPYLFEEQPEEPLTPAMPPASPVETPAGITSAKRAAGYCERCGAPLSATEVGFGVKLCARCTDAEVSSSHPVRVVKEQIGPPRENRDSKVLVEHRSLLMAPDTRLASTSLPGLRIEHVNGEGPDPVVNLGGKWGTPAYVPTRHRQVPSRPSGWHGDDTGRGLIGGLSRDEGILKSMQAAGLSSLWRTLVIIPDHENAAWNFIVDVPAEEVVVRCLDVIALFLLSSALEPPQT